MTTVSERVYSELPDQPEALVDAFELNKVVPRDFCTKYLAENVKSEGVLSKNEHELGYASFVIDPFKPRKKLPIFNRKNKKLTAKEKRKMRIHMPKTGQKYSTYLKLHQLWLDYMGEMLKYDRPTFNITNKNVRDLLLRADYHGCLVKVIQSKCPSYVGVTGIIILDTREAYKIISSNNVIKTIPKVTSTFSFRLGPYEVKIYGKNFTYRPMDRVARKFKVRSTYLDP